MADGQGNAGPLDAATHVATMDTRGMNNSHGSKLDSANLLFLGMEGLRPDGLVPVSHAAIKDAGSVSAALDQQKIGAALTSAVLYAVVVELVVKHIWEQEHARRQCAITTYIDCSRC